jgi:hypothetical protein
MAIIISQNGKNAKRINQTSFEKEDYLQKYIYDNPESIPLYDIQEDIKLLVVAREFPTPSGPIDALGIDQEGTLYVIETKLHKNPDKRLVVAQVLDYGASLWRHTGDFNTFIKVLDDKVATQFGSTLLEKLQRFFELETDEAQRVVDQLRLNMNGGVLKFVVLMDRLSDRLKDLIVYINENSKFDVYAVELEYYRHDDYEILIPRLYGAEVKKDLGVAGQSTPTETQKQQLEFWQQFLAFATARGSKLRFKPRSPSSVSFSQTIHLSRRDARLNLVTLAREGKLACQIAINDNKDLFAALRAQQPKFEKIIGSDLEWMAEEDTKRTRIRLTHDADLENTKEWPNQFDWLLATAEKFQQAFEEFAAQQQ